MQITTERFTSWLQRLTPWIGLVLFLVALAMVRRQVEIYHWHEIVAAVTGLEWELLAAALAITLLSYLALTFYDWTALSYAGATLPYRRVALAAFLSYAISNNVGHALISGGSMRYRLYSGWGLPATSIAKVVAFCAATYIIGMLTLLVLADVLAPLQPDAWTLPASRTSAWLSVAALLVWWLLIFSRRPLRIGALSLPLPSVPLTLLQTLVALLDLIMAALALYVLLWQQFDMPILSFLLCYALAQLLGLVSQVPGGLGVFESTFLFLTADHLPAAPVLAALIAYRIIYYFGPLLLAGLLLLGYELRNSRLLHLPVVRSTLEAADAAAPRVFALLLLLGGAVLLVSGATPAQPERLHWLNFIVPLPVMELSHLAGSIAGVMLLILAGAVRNRIDAGYYLSLAMLALGVVASLAKGFDYEEAVILGVMFGALLPTRKHFYRHSTLLHARYAPRWVALIGIILIGSTWLGLFAYKHVEYSNELWWHFSLHADAPRFLRSTLAAMVVLTGFFVWRLLARVPYRLERPSQDELERAAAIARNAGEAAALIALTGDKYLLWSDSGRSFLMFDISGAYWVVMGDPVGDPAEFEELVWHLRELADRNRSKLAFYEVGTKQLPLYLDLGMALIKLGEEARVPLAEFSLESKARAPLRHAYNRGQREGLTLEVIERDSIEMLLPQLQTISERWLDSKKAREKRFSVGFFAEPYLRHCRIALVRRGDEVLAFANLWELDSRAEFSLDLMRYTPEAPAGTMDFLLVGLMLWGREQGYEWFNLGMAPLSGLGQHPLAPLWHRIGNTLYRLGQEFYNFEGLHRYKSKFDPVWQPRYLAAPNGIAAASALVAAANLIAGGIKGIFSK